LLRSSNAYEVIAPQIAAGTPGMADHIFALVNPRRLRISRPLCAVWMALAA
jgi:hypothetical protein